MAPSSILIVGCGIAGPALASFLLLSPQAEPPHVTVVERSSSLPDHGQNIDIRGTGETIIRKLGLEAAVLSATTGEVGVQFVDPSNRVWAAFGAGKNSGTSDIEILRGRLAEILYKRSKAISEYVKKERGTEVEYIFGDYLDSIEQDDQKVHVQFAKSGEKRDFDIVVGADGLQSRTRRMVFGDEDPVKRLGMYAGFFSMPKGETDSKWRRWYHAPGRRGIMVRPSHLDDMSTVLVSVINDNDSRLPEAAKKGHQGVEEQKALLKEYFQDAGWESDRMIREMEAADDFYYDMVAQVKLPTWSKGRVVLLADAGYCASPISGMGTTLALNGAYNLAGALICQPDDHTAAFAQYEEKMRPLVDHAQKLAPGMPHLINPETNWGIWTMRAIVGALYWSGVAGLLFMVLGPGSGAKKVAPVEEYGIKQAEEWRE